MDASVIFMDEIEKIAKGGEREGRRGAQSYGRLNETQQALEALSTKKAIARSEAAKEAKALISQAGSAAPGGSSPPSPPSGAKTKALINQAVAAASGGSSPPPPPPSGAKVLNAAYNAIAEAHESARAGQAARGMNPWLKAGLIGLPATGAAAGGVYLIHKLLKKRKQQGA